MKTGSGAALIEVDPNALAGQMPGLSFTGNVGSTTVKLGGTVPIIGATAAASGIALDTASTPTAGTYSSKNVQTVVDTAATNNKGVQIQFAATPSFQGADMGGEKITNVAPGTLSATSTDAVNGSQLFAAVGTPLHYYSVNSTSQAAGSNYDNKGATGGNSLAAGVNASATGGSAVAAGDGAQAGGAYSVAIGRHANNGSTSTANDFSTVVGSGLETNTVPAVNNPVSGQTYTDASIAGYNGTAIGYAAQAFNSGGTAIGTRSHAGDPSKAANVTNPATAIGYASIAQGDGSSSVGVASVAQGNDSVAMGHRAYAVGTNAMAQGLHALATGDNSIALGNAAIAGNGVVGGGKITNGTVNSDIAVGNGAQATGGSSIAIGTGSKVSGANSGAFGDPSIINGANSYSVGNNNHIGSTTTDAFALGNDVNLGADASGADTTSVTGAVALGSNSGVTQAGGVALGQGSLASTAAGVAGYNPTGTTPTGATWNSTLAAVSVGSAGNTRQITNLAAGTQDTDAVNVAQLQAVNNAANAGWNVTDGTHSNNIGPDGKVTFTGDSNVTVTESGTDDDGTVTVALNKDVDLGSTGSLTTGNTVVNNGGLTIVGGPQFTSSNISAGGLQIHNVAAGTTGTDAVNLDQLNDTTHTIHDYSVKSSTPNNDSNYNNGGATGIDALAAGVNAQAQGIRSTAVGHGAGIGSTGDENTAMGDGAGQNVSSSANVGIGVNAGSNVTDTSPYASPFTITGNNVAVGGSAGQNVQGIANVGVGWKAGQGAIGNANVAVGPVSGNKVNGNANTAIGQESGEGTKGSYNAALGNFSGSNVTGSNNLAAGNNAGNGINANYTISLGTSATASQDYGTAIGRYAGVNGTGGIAIGGGPVPGTNNWVKANGANSISIGSGAGNGASSTVKENIAIGTGAGINVVSQQNVVMGSNAGADITNVASSGSTGSDGQTGKNTVIGTDAGSGLAGNENAGLGFNSLNLADGNNNVGLGAYSGWKAKGDLNIYQGNYTGSGTSGNSNVAIGNYAGNRMTNSSRNVFLGEGAGSGNANGQTTDSDYNVAIGSAAGQGLQNVTESIALGRSSNAASQSVAIGTGSTVTGTNSIAVGTGSKVDATNSGVFGDPSYIGPSAPGTGPVDGSYAVGNNNTINASNAFVLGNNVTVGTGLNGSVALGNASAAAINDTTANGGKALFSGVITPTGGAVSVGAQGAERQIKNVAGGTADTDAVNIAQLKAVNDVASEGWNLTTGGETAKSSNVAPGDTVDFSNTDGNIDLAHNGNDVTAELSDKVVVGAARNGGSAAAHPVTIDGNTGLVGGLTNTTFDPNTTYTGGFAATQEQLSEASSDLTKQGLNFTGNDATAGVVHRDLGQTLAINGGATTAGSYSGANLKTVTDPSTGAINLQFADTPSFQGADMGGKKVTNVADGTDPKDAVNFSQLNDTTHTIHDYSVNSTNPGTDTNYLNAGATGANALAAGVSAAAAGINSVAVGNKTGVGSTGDNNVAMGDSAGQNVVSSTNVGIGQSAGSGVDDVTTQYKPFNVSGNNVAVGGSAGQGVHGTTNVGIGWKAGQTVDGNANVGVGALAGQNVIGSINTGVGASAGQGVRGNGNAALGNFSGNSVTGGNNVAVGNSAGNGISASSTVSVGYNSTASADDAMALGHGAQTSVAGNVALGSSSTANDAQHTGSFLIAGATGPAAGLNNGAQVVSVGSDGAERQIQNVAPGVLSDTSTDAVNGSQLFATNQQVAQNTKFQSHYYSVDDGGTHRANYNNDGATGLFALAAGVGATATEQSATAVGFNAAATGSASTAAGAGSVAQGDQSAAFGNNAKALANSSVAVGQATANAASSIAAGQLAAANGVSSIAMGTNATASHTGSIAMGNGAVAGDDTTLPEASNAIALGSQAHASKQNAVAIGKGSSALGVNAIAIGTGNTVTGNNSGAFGDPNNVTGSGSYAFGNNNTVGSDNAFVLGNNVNMSTGFDGSVTLGNNSVAANNAAGLAKFSDAPIPVGGAVSVGAQGAERQIKNVAGGTDDTDAVNIAQLKAGTAAATTKVAAGTNVNDVTATTNADGSTTYTVNADGASVSGDSNFVVTKGAKDANNVTDYNLALAPVLVVGSTHPVTIDGKNGLVGGLTNTTFDPNATYTGGFAATQEQLKAVSDVANEGWNVSTNGNTAGQSNVAPGATVDFSTTNSNLTVDHTGTDVTVGLSNNLDLGAAGSVKAGDTTVNNAGVKVDDGAGNSSTLTTGGLDVADGSNSTHYGADGMTIAGGPTITASNVDMGGQQVHGVQAGTADNDAVNVSQLKSGIAGATTEVQGGTNIASVDKTTGADGHAIYTVNADGASVSAGSSAVTVTKAAPDSNNVTDYAVDLSQGTKDDIQKGVDAKTTVDTKGLTFTGDTGTTGAKLLGSSVAVTGDSNITTTADSSGVKVGLNKDVNLGSDGSVTVGGTTVNNNGVTTGGGEGPSVTTGGVDAGGKTVTNVAPGVNATDAVNVGQVQGALGDLNHRINKVGRNADAGVASAIATANLPQPYRPGQSMASAALGAFRGQGALAVGLSTITENGSWVFKASVNANSQGKVGVGVGAGFVW